MENSISFLFICSSNESVTRRFIVKSICKALIKVKKNNIYTSRIEEQYELSEETENKNLEQIEDISFLYYPEETMKTESNQKKSIEKKKKEEQERTPGIKKSSRKRTPEKNIENDKTSGIEKEYQYKPKFNNEALNNSFFFVEPVYQCSKRNIH